MFKAVLLDQDQTLTRGPLDVFCHASYESHVQLLQGMSRQGDVLEREAFDALYKQMCGGTTSLIDQFSDHFGFDKEAFLAKLLSCVSADTLTHDTESAALLNDCTDRILLFTDAPRQWAEARAAGIGHRLRIQAADDIQHETGTYEIKGAAGARWAKAVEALREMSGDPTLQPADILVIDDHMKVLETAQALGYQTGQALYGFPDMPHDPRWMYHVPHVGTFLQQHGFAVLQKKSA